MCLFAAAKNFFCYPLVSHMKRDFHNQEGEEFVAFLNKGLLPCHDMLCTVAQTMVMQLKYIWGLKFTQLQIGLIEFVSV